MQEKDYQGASATAKATYVRITPRKVGIVLDLIRNACEPLFKLLTSAVANAENNHNMDVTRLYVAECYVGQGPTLKRIRPRARGSADRVEKKSSHITLVLREAE